MAAEYLEIVRKESKLESTFFKHQKMSFLMENEPNFL